MLGRRILFGFLFVCLLFSKPAFAASDWVSLEHDINKLWGKTSLYLRRPSGTVFEIRPTDPHPLASTFKLYVLGALVDAVKEETLAWNAPVTLESRLKSVGSGIMNLWPAGSKVTVEQLATAMAAKSDNTATDHLIDLLGRATIEKQFEIMGNDFLRRNVPLLKTGDWFRLKWAVSPAELEYYLSASESEKRRILEQELPKIPLTGIGLNGVPMMVPAAIQTIEWFASPANLCRAMDVLRSKEEPRVLKMLEKHKLFLRVGPNQPWKYVGYKGGYETGVLAATFLLQDHAGRWACLSFAWHDEERDLSESVFTSLTRRALLLVEEK